MFFQSSNKLRKRTHHSGILHFAGTCFHVKVSLVKFIECACFMLLHGVQLWVSSPKSLIKATNAAAVCTLRLLRCAETAGYNDDNDIRRLKRKMKRVWTRSTALCSTVAPCSTKPSTTDGANTKHMHPHQRNWMSRPITRVLVSTKLETFLTSWLLLS